MTERGHREKERKGEGTERGWHPERWRDMDDQRDGEREGKKQGE